MSTKPANIKRRVPVVDVIIVEKQHDRVKWTIDAKKEDTEFTIKFTGANPLKAGEDTSKDHELEREIDPKVPRGQNLHFSYTITLTRTGEKVEGPPKGKDVSGPEIIIV